MTTTTKKKVPARGVRGKTPQQKMEAAVAGIGRSIGALVKLVEREGTKLKVEEVQKAFAFVGLTNTAAQQKAAAAVQAAGLSDFSLSKALPVLAGIPIAAAQITAAHLVASAPQASSPVPAVRGPDVREIGGRFVSEARKRPQPAAETPSPESMPDDEPGFLDEDETDTDTDTEND